MPWFVYVGVGAALLLAARTVAKIATDTIQAIQEEDEREQQGKTGDKEQPKL